MFRYFEKSEKNLQKNSYIFGKFYRIGKFRMILTKFLNLINCNSHNFRKIDPKSGKKILICSVDLYKNSEIGLKIEECGMFNMKFENLSDV